MWSFWGPLRACRQAVKAVEGTAGQPEGEVQLGEGASGAGGGLHGEFEGGGGGEEGQTRTGDARGFRWSHSVCPGAHQAGAADRDGGDFEKAEENGGILSKKYSGEDSAGRNEGKK